MVYKKYDHPEDKDLSQETLRRWLTLEHRFSIDSRTLRSGEVFCDLSCTEAYVRDAIAHGASEIVSAHSYSELADIYPDVIFTNYDAHKTLNLCAAYKRNNISAKYVAITGSVGKTSTKELVAYTLAQHTSTYKTRGNYNNALGLPLCMSNMPSSCDVAIFELGMSALGELSHLKSILRPDISVILNVEPVHIAQFSSLSEIAEAKSELLPTDTAILPQDSAFADFFREKNAGRRSHFFSLGAMREFRYKECDGYVQSYEHNGAHTHIKAKIFDKTIEYELTCASEHSVISSIVALMLAEILGFDASKSASSFATYINPERFNVQKCDFGYWVDDSYNASVASIRSAISALDRLPALSEECASPRKIVVLGDIKEAGEGALAMHQSIAAILGKYHVHKLFCLGENMYHLHKIIENSEWFLSHNLLQCALNSYIIPGDVVLVKGSHSMEMGRVRRVK